MCKPSKPKAAKIPDPVVLTNPLLDANRGPQGAALAARAGRSSLRIPLSTGLGIGFSGRGSTGSGTGTAGPRGNARRTGGQPGNANLPSPHNFRAEVSRSVGEVGR